MRAWIRERRRGIADRLQALLSLGAVLPGDAEQEALEPDNVVRVDFARRAGQSADEPMACA